MPIHRLYDQASPQLTNYQLSILTEMESQDDNKLYTAVIRKSRHNVIIAFAITSMDFSEAITRLRGSLKGDTDEKIKDSDMVLISQGLEIEQYEGFTKYAHGKFDHHDITVRDLQDLWVTYAKEHGFSRPEDTAYANGDGTSQYQSAKPGQNTINPNTTAGPTSSTSAPNAGTDAALPNTAKDDSHPIHDDVFVPYDHNISGKFINNALGISDERVKVIGNAIKVAVNNEIARHDPQGISSAAILSNSSKVAKTHAELLFIGYLLGVNLPATDADGNHHGGAAKFGSGDLDHMKDLIDMLTKLHDLKSKAGGSDDHFNFSAMMADANKKAAQN